MASTPVSREEFNNLRADVSGIQAKLTEISEKTIEGIAELSGDVKSITQLLKESAQSAKQNNILCRAQCDDRLKKVENRQDEIEKRVRTQEINWAKLVGIALAVSAASGVITGLVLKFIP